MGPNRTYLAAPRAKKDRFGTIISSVTVFL